MTHIPDAGVRFNSPEQFTDINGPIHIAASIGAATNQFILPETARITTRVILDANGKPELNEDGNKTYSLAVDSVVDGVRELTNLMTYKN